MVFMKLFLKIFIWFWLAMVVVGAALIISVATTGPTSSGPPWFNLVEGTLRLQAREAVNIFERGGPASLDAYLKEMEVETDIDIYLFNDQGREVRGRTPPAGADLLVRQSAESATGEFRFQG